MQRNMCTVHSQGILKEQYLEKEKDKNERKAIVERCGLNFPPFQGFFFTETELQTEALHQAAQLLAWPQPEGKSLTDLNRQIAASPPLCGFLEGGERGGFFPYSQPFQAHISPSTAAAAYRGRPAVQITGL